MRLLLLDNHDSYTYNLAQLLGAIDGCEVAVVRNDEAPWAELREQAFDGVVVSPGPGRPERPADFGACADAIRETRVPLLGVCLGHQGLAHVLGGRIVHAPEPVHGRLSAIRHDGDPLFDGIPERLAVVRYHSLVVAEPLPPCLRVIARTDDGLVMALRHATRPLWGVQFHPESVATEHGARLLANFTRLIGAHAAARTAAAAPPPPAHVPAVASRAARDGGRVLWRRLGCWVEPRRAFDVVAGDEPWAFWLDSSDDGAAGSRFSYLGAPGPAGERVVYRVAPSRLTLTRGAETVQRDEPVLDFLERDLRRRAARADELPFDFCGGWVGYLGYELKADCGARTAQRSALPDAALVRVERLVVLDHRERHVYLVGLADDATRADATRWLDATAAALQDAAHGGHAAHAPRPAHPASRAARPRGPVRFRLARPHARYLDEVRTCLAQIVDGESYELCLTNALHTDARPDPLALHAALRRANPAPYAALLRCGEMAVVCSSPECFLRVDRDGVVESRPIKGTAPRGGDARRDGELLARLAGSDKDRAENLMIVDLVRNDLGRVCEPGSVHVPRLFAVESYATVHQLVSTVRGRLRAACSAVDCIRAAFPGGSMTGAPKRRSMEILERLEGAPRGVYSGALGWLGVNGAAELNIVIRTAVVTPEGTSIGTGGAIVAASDPQAELDETLLKARAVAQAVADVAGGGAGDWVLDDGRRPGAAREPSRAP